MSILTHALAGVVGALIGIVTVESVSVYMSYRYMKGIRRKEET